MFNNIIPASFVLTDDTGSIKSLEAQLSSLQAKIRALSGISLRNLDRLVDPSRTAAMKGQAQATAQMTEAQRYMMGEYSKTAKVMDESATATEKATKAQAGLSAGAGKVSGGMRTISVATGSAVKTFDHFDHVMGTGNVTFGQMAKTTVSMRGVLNRLGHTAASTSAKFSGLFKQLTTGALAFVAFNIAAKSIREMVSSVVEFDAEIVNFKAIAGATNSQVKELTQTTNDLATTYRYAQHEIAASATTLAKAGFDVRDSLEAVAGITALAQGTMEGLEVATNVATVAIKAFHLTAGDTNRIVNALAAGVLKSRLNLHDFDIALNYVAATAYNADLSLEDLIASMAAMANVGMRASTIGTSLRGVLSNLLRPTQRMRGVFERLGVSVSDINPKMHNFIDIILTLKDAGVTVGDVYAAMDKRIATGLAALLDQADTLKDLRSRVTGTTTAFDVASTQMDSFTNQMKKLGNQFRETLLPFIQKVMTSVAAMANGFLGAAKVLGIFGGLLKSLIGPALTSIFIIGLVKAYFALKRYTHGMATAVMMQTKFGADLAALDFLLKKEIITLEFYNAEVGRIQIAAMKGVTGLAKLKAAFAGLLPSLISFGTYMAIGLVVSKAVSAIQYYFDTAQQLKDQVDALNNSTKNYTETLKQNLEITTEEVVKVSEYAKAVRQLHSEISGGDLKFSFQLSVIENLVGLLDEAAKTSDKYSVALRKIAEGMVALEATGREAHVDRLLEQAGKHAEKIRKEMLQVKAAIKGGGQALEENIKIMARFAEQSSKTHGMAGMAASAAIGFAASGDVPAMLGALKGLIRYNSEQKKSIEYLKLISYYQEKGREEIENTNIEKERATKYTEMQSRAESRLVAQRENIVGLLKYTTELRKKGTITANEQKNILEFYSEEYEKQVEMYKEIVELAKKEQEVLVETLNYWETRLTMERGSLDNLKTMAEVYKGYEKSIGILVLKTEELKKIDIEMSAAFAENLDTAKAIEVVYGQQLAKLSQQKLAQDLLVDSTSAQLKQFKELGLEGSAIAENAKLMNDYFKEPTDTLLEMVDTVSNLNKELVEAGAEALFFDPDQVTVGGKLLSLRQQIEDIDGRILEKKGQIEKATQSDSEAEKEKIPVYQEQLNYLRSMKVQKEADLGATVETYKASVDLENIYEDLNDEIARLDEQLKDTLEFWDRKLKFLALEQERLNGELARSTEKLKEIEAYHGAEAIKAGREAAASGELTEYQKIGKEIEKLQAKKRTASNWDRVNIQRKIDKLEEERLGIARNAYLEYETEQERQEYLKRQIERNKEEERVANERRAAEIESLNKQKKGTLEIAAAKANIYRMDLIYDKLKTGALQTDAERIKYAMEYLKLSNETGDILERNKNIESRMAKDAQNQYDRHEKKIKDIQEALEASVEKNVEAYKQAQAMLENENSRLEVEKQLKTIAEEVRNAKEQEKESVAAIYDFLSRFPDALGAAAGAAQALTSQFQFQYNLTAGILANIQAISGGAGAAGAIGSLSAEDFSYYFDQLGETSGHLSAFDLALEDLDFADFQEYSDNFLMSEENAEFSLLNLADSADLVNENAVDLGNGLTIAATGLEQFNDSLNGSWNYGPSGGIQPENFPEFHTGGLNTVPGLANLTSPEYIVNPASTRMFLQELEMINRKPRQTRQLFDVMQDVKGSSRSVQIVQSQSGPIPQPNQGVKTQTLVLDFSSFMGRTARYSVEARRNVIDQLVNDLQNEGLIRQ